MSRRYSIWLCDNQRDLIVASWENLSDVDVMGIISGIQPALGITIEIRIKDDEE